MNATLERTKTGPWSRKVSKIGTWICVTAMLVAVAQPSFAGDRKNKQRRGTPTKQNQPRQKVPLKVAKQTQNAPSKQPRKAQAKRPSNRERSNIQQRSARSSGRQTQAMQQRRGAESRFKSSAMNRSRDNRSRASQRSKPSTSVQRFNSSRQSESQREQGSHWREHDRGRGRDHRGQYERRDWVRPHDGGWDRHRENHRDRYWRRNRHFHHHDHDRTRVDIDIDLRIGGGWWSKHRRYRPPSCPPYRRIIVYKRPVVYCPPPIIKHVVIHRDYICPPVYKAYVGCNGWDLLASGYARKALCEFQRQAAAYPHAGLPRVGIAIAEAMLHDHAGAAYAMKRAFREDPDALNHVPISEALDYQLRSLIDTYEYKLSCNPYHDDHHFMIAALSFFRHDYGRARHELSYVLSEPGCDDAAWALDELLYYAEYEG